MNPDVDRWLERLWRNLNNSVDSPYTLKVKLNLFHENLSRRIVGFDDALRSELSGND